MIRTQLRNGTLPWVAALTVALAATAFPGALAAQRGQLADTVVYVNGVDFQIYEEFARATLEVSGNGRVLYWAFDAGDQPSIGLFDPDGQPLADGVYSYQLKLVPNAATARELRIAASLNGGNAPDAWEDVGGVFTVAGGAIADPSFSEDQALRRSAESAGSRPGTRAAAPFSADRTGHDDSDAEIGSRTGVEARLNAAAARQSAAAAAGVLGQPDRTADDSDAVARALGGSFEPAGASDSQLAAESRGAPVPKPRSDGSNGRPRS